MKVSVRGIYSTGLIRFLLEKGYELTRLSDKQKERFNIDNDEEPDITITDTIDKTGIKIKGDNINRLIEDLKEVFWDSLFVKKPKSSKAVTIIPHGYEFIGLPESKIEEIKREVIPNIPQDVGVVFKKPTMYLSSAEIVAEISTLISKHYNVYYVYWGYNSKLILDEFRSFVLRTLRKHHVYRRRLSDILDFSEILIDKIEEDYVHYGIKQFVANKLSSIGNITRYHRKTYGKLLRYKELILDIDIYDNRLYLRTFRPITSSGIYDGLGIEKNPGDYVITEYLEGSWYFTMTYYNKNKELLGKYININTPLEITTDIYYNDLALDVIHKDNDRFIVDFDELEILLKEGYITRKAYNKSREIADILLNSSTFS